MRKEEGNFTDDYKKLILEEVYKKLKIEQKDIKTK